MIWTISNHFWGFFEYLWTPQFPSEISWPLAESSLTFTALPGLTCLIWWDIRNTQPAQQPYTFINQTVLLMPLFLILLLLLLALSSMIICHAIGCIVLLFCRKVTFSLSWYAFARCSGQYSQYFSFFLAETCTKLDLLWNFQ